MTISGATQQADYGSYHDGGCAQADHLGVVFVHGVGFQKRGETLLSWSDRLIGMLSAKYGGVAGDPVDLVHRSEIYLDDQPKASSIEVRIPRTDSTRAQHWLLTEAFWAASIQPPSVPTMLRWLGARGAAALAAVGPARAFRNSVYLTSVVIGVLVLYAAIRAITSLLPIASIRNAVVVPLDRYLTGWSGDMHVLLFDPPQSANIRTQVSETVKGLAAAQFQRIVLIGHSGGAVAAYMSLTDPSLWSAGTSPVVSLITHGQGLNIAWRLCGVGDGGECDAATGSGRRLTEPLRKLHPNLRWHDYYSIGDTVPETELRPPACLADEVAKKADSHQIRNVPSNPHGSYWDNDEEFVLPVIQRLLQEAPMPNPGQKPDPLPEPAEGALKNRRRRIGMASFTSRVLFASMVAAIVGGTFLGGARLDDLGQFVATILTQIPLVGLLAGPQEWIQAETSSGWWTVPTTAGAIVFSILLVLLAAYPIIRLLAERPESGYRGSDLIGWLLGAADWLAALLPASAVAAWVVLVLVAGDAGVAPGWAVWPAIVIAGIRLLVAAVRTASRGSPASTGMLEGVESAARSGLGVMLIVPVVAFLAFGTLLAIVANADFGGTRLGEVALGAAVVWLFYRLLGGVTNWRWNAWDEQEREQFRQDLNPSIQRTAERRWGRRIDLLVIGFGCTAAVILAAAVGAPLMDIRAAWLAGAIVIGLIVLIWIVGAGQDAANSRGGVEAPEMTPLPTAS